MGNACSIADVDTPSKHTPNSNVIVGKAAPDLAQGVDDKLEHRYPAHVSKAAVSLAWLKDFVRQHNLDENKMTTSQLVAQLVKPPTAARRCRFSELLLADTVQAHHVSQGRPFYFVSHAWCRPFAETLGMVARHFEPGRQRLWRRQQQQQQEQQQYQQQQQAALAAAAAAASAGGTRSPLQPQPQPSRQPQRPQQPQQAEELLPLLDSEVFLWFDMFAINQHNPGAGDLAALHEVIQDAQGTLMVLDPEGSPLTRIWCLYEAWQTGRAGPGKIRILSYGLESEDLEKVFVDLDVSRAQASVEADRVRILADIEASLAGGLHQMTHELKDALVAGTVAQVFDVGDAWTPQLGSDLHTAATLCQLYGKMDEAEVLYRRNMAGARATLGPDDPWVPMTVDNLASMLKARGKTAEAEALHREALEAFERVLGRDHPGTLAAVNNLALVLQDQGRYGEAEQLHRRALADCERLRGLLGDADSSGQQNTSGAALRALNNLALVLQDQGKYGEAAELYGRLYGGLEETLGPDHPATLSAVANLASLHRARGEYGEAEALHRRALAGRERVLGYDHADTLRSANNLANALVDQGKYDEAEPLHRRVYGSLERVLGADHPDTLSSLNNVATVLQNQGKYGETEELHRRALAGRERALGCDHPDVLDSVDNLSRVVWALGRMDEAEELARRALEGRRQVLGPDHPDTQASRGHLGVVLAARKKDMALQDASSGGLGLGRRSDDEAVDAGTSAT